MGIRVSVPNRIDLAGGTTDIYPLYLFMDGGCTVNVGISVDSSVEFRTLEASVIRIVSRDLGEEMETSDPAHLPTDGPLSLITRAVRALTPAPGVEIVTNNQAPPGSGLGASSALLVALVAGLLKLRSESFESVKVVDLAAAIECAIIQVPTGKQDHIAAYFGGVSSIEFGFHGFSRTELCAASDHRKYLADMMILSYTGEGRFSGMNNWDVTKGFIDNQPEIRVKLRKIRDVAQALTRALLLHEWDEIPRLVGQEWAIRRELAPGITTPRIDRMAAAATAAGATAGKVCGAGGGGCMLTLAPNGNRSAVERAISEEGGKILPFCIEPEGLKFYDTYEIPKDGGY